MNPSPAASAAAPVHGRHDFAAEPSPNTPPWVNPLALRVDTIGDRERIRVRSQEAGIEGIGVTGHHVFSSIRIFEPNGIGLELPAQLASEMRMLEESRSVHARLAQWTRRKDEWRAQRTAGQAGVPPRPQRNDRPEVAERARLAAGKPGA